MILIYGIVPSGSRKSDDIHYGDGILRYRAMAASVSSAADSERQSP